MDLIWILSQSSTVLFDYFINHFGKCFILIVKLFVYFMYKAVFLIFIQFFVSLFILFPFIGHNCFSILLIYFFANNKSFTRTMLSHFSKNLTIIIILAFENMEKQISIVFKFFDDFKQLCVCPKFYFENNFMKFSFVIQLGSYNLTNKTDTCSTNYTNYTNSCCPQHCAFLSHHSPHQNFSNKSFYPLFQNSSRLVTS